MLGSGKAKRPDTKLLDNLIAAQKKLAASLANARTASESSGLATSAWATPDGPTSMHKTAILTRALAATGTALDDYTLSVADFTHGLQDLLPQEAAVAEVSRDRDILVSRLVRLTKKKPKTGQEDKHLSVLANTQQELAACETVLASEQNALSQVRHQTLSDHARARLLALHLFGAQTQQAAAEALQQLDSFNGTPPPWRFRLMSSPCSHSVRSSAYASAPSPPQTPQTAQIPAQQQHHGDARSIAQSYMTQQQRAAAYSGTAQPQYAVPATTSASLAPASVYEAAPSYQSAEGLSYPRDAQAPTVAPVQEGDEAYEGSSVFDPSSQPGADGAEAEVDIVAVGGEPAPSRRYNAQALGTTGATGAPSPYRSAEVGYVLEEPVAPPHGGNDGRMGRQEPVALGSEIAQRPQPGQPVLVVDEVFMTPVEEVGYDELQGGGYSSSDPDDNAQEHLGPYAAGPPQRSVSNRYDSTRSGAVAQPQLYKKRTARTVSHRKHNSEPNDTYTFGPDGAIDAVGQPGRFTAQQGFADDSSVDEPSKLSRHLSLMGNSKKDNNSSSSKHHSTQGHGHNFLSRLNSVLKTDITVAAAEAAHQEVPEEENRGGLLHRSHSSSSSAGKHHRQSSKRSSHKAGNSVLPVEEGASEDELATSSTNPMHSTWKTRTDKNLRGLGTEAPAARTVKQSLPKRTSASPLDSPAPPPLELGSYAEQPDVYGAQTPKTAKHALDAEASSLASTEPQTPHGPDAAWSHSPAIATAGTESIQGTPVTRRKNLSSGPPPTNPSYTPNLAASQGEYRVVSSGLGLESPLAVAREGEAAATRAAAPGYISGDGNHHVSKEKPRAREEAAPVLVKKVVRVKKSSKKPAHPTAKPTGSRNKGAASETARYAASSQRASAPASPGGLYQATAPGSALDGFPSVPKAPRASDYNRPFRTSHGGRAGTSRASDASSEDALPEYLRTQAQRAASGYSSGRKPYSSVARGVIA